MSEFIAGPARVPDELAPLIDNHFLETQERWQNATFDEVVPSKPELQAVQAGGEHIRVARLAPYEEADGSVVALAYPFQQGHNKTMMLRAAFMQQAVTPHSEVLLLPNIHTGKNRTFTLNTDDKRRLAEGSLAPVAEKYIRALETLKVGNIALTGYSQGARMSVEMAAVGSPEVSVTHVNADEAPTMPGRGAKQLQKHFMKSGAFGLQRKSMAEAGFGSLLERTAGTPLAIDYAVFGIRSLGTVSKLIHKGMTGSMSETLNQALNQYDELQIKLGMVTGSLLTDPTDLILWGARKNDVRGVVYTGEAANMHTTGDNYAAHALMVKDGLR